MTDHIARGQQEYKIRLDNIIKLAKEAQHTVDTAYRQAQTELSRDDYVNVDESQTASRATTTLGAATDLIDIIADQCTILSAADIPQYRREVRVNFPAGITHFVVDNGGTAGVGRIVMYGRNDTPTQLFEELFVAGDVVTFLTSTKLAATDLNVQMTIATVSNNTIEFTAAFGTAPTAGNDYTLRMVMLTHYIA